MRKKLMRWGAGMLAAAVVVSGFGYAPKAYASEVEETPDIEDVSALPEDSEEAVEEVEETLVDDVELEEENSLKGISLGEMETGKLYSITMTAIMKETGKTSGMYSFDNTFVTKTSDSTYLVKMRQKSGNRNTLAFTDNGVAAKEHAVEWYYAPGDGGEAGYTFVLPFKSLEGETYAVMSSKDRIIEKKDFSNPIVFSFDTSSLKVESGEALTEEQVDVDPIAWKKTKYTITRNANSMFKVIDAYVKETVLEKYLCMTLSGTSYKKVYKGDSYNSEWEDNYYVRTDNENLSYPEKDGSINNESSNGKYEYMIPIKDDDYITVQLYTSKWGDPRCIYINQDTKIIQVGNYAIRYELNGGVDNESNSRVYAYTKPSDKKPNPDNSPVALNPVTKKGYKFEGWYLDSKMTESSKITEVVYAEDSEDITIYAKWSPIPYTLTYNTNGGTNNSSNPASYNVETEVALKAPTKKGYAFDGWYTESAFTNKVTSIAKGTTGNISLFAKWTKEKYDIAYNLNGGKNNASNPATYDIDTAVSLNNPSKKGYTFKGWFTDSAFKNATTEIKKGQTGKVSVYAKWSRNKYTITYKLNGGTNSNKNPISYNVDSKKITLVNPSKKGYKFEGWYADSKLKKKASATISKGSTGNKTYYAKWSKVSYKIDYKLNKGMNNKKNPTKYTVTTKTIKLSAPTKKGYKFQGWYDNKNFNGKKVTQIKKGSAGKVTLYAKWKKK